MNRGGIDELVGEAVRRGVEEAVAEAVADRLRRQHRGGGLPIPRRGAGGDVYQVIARADLDRAAAAAPPAEGARDKTGTLLSVR
jgi:hypothetical protein